MSSSSTVSPAPAPAPARAVRRLALAAGLALSAFSFGSAQAATMTLSGWTWGQGHNVSVSAPNFDGAAGGFSGTLTGSGIAGLDGAIQTYCIEIGQGFAFNVAYADVSVVAASSVWSPLRTSRLSRLLSYVTDANLFGQVAASNRDELSTAVQLAIWNIVNDVDMSLNGGSFGASGSFVTGSLARTGFLGANALLEKAGTAPITQQLWVLRSPTAQDQILWRPLAASLPPAGQLPEPASLALAGVALVAALGIGRGRRRAGAPAA